MSIYKCLLGVVCIVHVQAILEKNRGVEEWYQQNLGELSDVKFIELASDS